MMRRVIWSLVLVAALSGVALAARQSAPSYPTPEGSPTVNGLAGFAKILCSAVFISGRNDAEAARNSAYFFMPRAEQDKVTWTIDKETRTVTATFGADSQSAKFYGDQGCIIQNPKQPGIHFTPCRYLTPAGDAAVANGRSCAGGPPPVDRDDGRPRRAFADPPH
jgi:hypothetical protein